MNYHQHESTTPVWTPTPEDMDAQQLQNTQWAGSFHSIGSFLLPSHSAPWNPLVGEQQPLATSQGPWTSAYRDTRILSEDGTAPESAVGDSQFRYEDTISLTEAGQETVGAARMQQMLDVVHLGNHLGPHMPSMRDDTIEVASTYSSTTAATSNRLPSKCPLCDKVCHSPSSLKKHSKVHSRPNLCNYANCNKAKKGFSTLNDLQRHKWSVHNEANFRYVCTKGDCSRGSRPKKFTRKDNFRVHMRQVHKMGVSIEEAEVYLVKVPHDETTALPSDAAPSEDLADTLPTGTNSQIADSMPMEVDQQYGNQQVTNPILPEVTHHTDFHTNSPLPLQHLSFQGLTSSVGMSFTTESAHSLHSPQPTGFGSQSFTTQPMSMSTGGIFVPSTASNHSYHTSTQQGPPSHCASVVDEMPAVYSPKTSSVFSSSAPRENLTVASSQKVGTLSHATLVNQGWTTSQLVDHLGTFPVELLQQALKSKQSSEGTNEAEENSASKSRHQCSHCAKVCNRACELKKHMKRHDRPYGCTVKDCGKNFGSKNDWKRHEGTQHTAFEAWACDADGCIDICEDRLSFMQHLREAHDMVHDEDIQPRAQSCRIGGRYDARFWCGFCCRVIGIDDMMLQEDNGNATPWSRRCDHIDNHLCGKGGLPKKDKIQWRFLEDEAKADTRQRMHYMSTTASVWSMTTSNGVPYKRKGSEHADNRPRKRADGQWAAGNC